jgi:hypothetical protein
VPDMSVLNVVPLTQVPPSEAEVLRHRWIQSIYYYLLSAKWLGKRFIPMKPGLPGLLFTLVIAPIRHKHIPACGDLLHAGAIGFHDIKIACAPGAVDKTD